MRLDLPLKHRQKFPLESAEFTLSSEFDGHAIGAPVILFERIPEKCIAELEKLYSGKKSSELPLDLVVGTVEFVEDHPSADSLWVLTVQKP